MPSAATGSPPLRDARLSGSERGGHALVRITSPHTVSEPIVRVVLDNLCHGGLRREYTLLLPFPDLAAAPPPATAPVEPATPRRTTAASPDRAPPPRAAPAGDPPPPRPASPASRGQDRLILLGDEDMPGASLRMSLELSAPPLNGTQLDAVLREQSLLGTVDQSIVVQLELAERLRRLERVHAALLAQSELLRAQGAAPASASAARADWLVPAALFIALSLGVALLLWLHQRRLARRQLAREQSHSHAPHIARSASALAASAPRPAQNDPAARPAQAAWPDEDGPADEHESAVELADIMLNLGRVHGAAETLADLIQRAPKRSLTPWLKLLKAYRLADMRTEFQALARQLNKTFNVQTVTWDEFDSMHLDFHSIEQLPHIIAQIQRLWGTRECQAYLDGLLRDNRDGTRQGFPLGVTDDILMLVGILEERLGRYLPEEAAEPPAAPVASAPPPAAPPAPAEEPQTEMGSYPPLQR